MNKLLIHAWALYKVKEAYFLPYTHWIYLREIMKHAKQVVLLSPVKELDAAPEGMHSIDEAGPGVSVMPLPFARNYISAIKYFFHYQNAYRRAAGCSKVYVRYPVPFGWLSMFQFKKGERIFHFVGDPSHTVEVNSRLSAWQKKIIKGFFKPEHLMYMRACKGSSVFTNGTVLQKKLEQYGITATPLVSSTLVEEDYHFDDGRQINRNALRLIYVGYLRKSKGLETLAEAFRLICKRYRNATLTIVGTGESEQQFKNRIGELQLSAQCTFKGHIENRKEINSLLRQSDLFIFPSLSEGSPRAVLEAMANSLPVISTPVGSLPGTFTDNEEILFVDFNDARAIAAQVDHLAGDPELLRRLRRNAYNKSKRYTLHLFIKRIFGEA